LVTIGNVGIGTSNLAEKLNVEGKIRAREVRVEATLWPDYVFRKKYKLPTLKEIEIKLNNMAISLKCHQRMK
jgi:hypothetical protein